MKTKTLNRKTWLCLLLVLAQLMLLTIPVVADGSTTPTEVVGLNETASLLGNEFRFFLPDAEDENLLSQTYELSSPTAPSLIETTITLNNASLDISANKVAYIAYKLKNTGTVALSLGTRLDIFCKVTREAGASLPLVYDVKTGEKLDYEMESSKRSDSTLRTISIPAGAEVYMVIPITSVNGDNYVPSLPQASNGNLIARNTSSRKTTADIEERYNSATGGYLYLKSFRVYCVQSGGSVEVSECYAMSMTEYTERYNEFDFTMQEGASVRLGTPTGLRFTATVDSNDWDYLVNRYGAENVTMGTIITPETYATTAGGMTFAKLEALTGVTTKYLNVEAGDFYKKVGNQFAIAGSIAKISENNYTKNYTAVAYVKVVDGDSTFYLYAADAQTRNISYVADQAIKDTKPAEDKENGYIYDLGNGTWSCYDPETEIPILQGFVVSQG